MAFLWAARRIVNFLSDQYQCAPAAFLVIIFNTGDQHVVVGGDDHIHPGLQGGMGDVVFAPMHQALRLRGVRIEYFHRVDQVRLDDDRRYVERVTLGRQVALAPGRDQYDPLVRVKELPCFASRVDPCQVVGADDIDEHDLESFWCAWPDAELVELRRGIDFDDGVNFYYLVTGIAVLCVLGVVRMGQQMSFPK